jgi:ABC superfamily ATP binding cassette transporter, ABC protein
MEDKMTEAIVKNEALPKENYTAEGSGEELKNENIIEIKGLGKTFKTDGEDFVALDQIDLSIRRGSIQVLSVFPVPENPPWFVVSTTWKSPVVDRFISGGRAWAP